MKLFKTSWDCNIYKISDDIIYKQYDKKCLGYVFENKRNPASLIKDFPCAEKVIDYDDYGFKTCFLQDKFGTFNKIDLQLVKEKGIDKLEKLIQELKNLNRSGTYHQDIRPDHIYYDNFRKKWILIDWTHLNRPSILLQDFFTDEWTIQRLKSLTYQIEVKDKYISWFINTGINPVHWLAGFLSRWILTTVKGTSFWDAIHMYVDLLFINLKTIEDLTNYLIRNCPQNHIDLFKKLTECLYHVHECKICNWQRFGKVNLIDTIRFGLSFLCGIPNKYGKLEHKKNILRQLKNPHSQLYGNMKALQNSFPVQPEWDNYI